MVIVNMLDYKVSANGSYDKILEMTIQWSKSVVHCCAMSVILTETASELVWDFSIWPSSSSNSIKKIFAG